MPNHHFTINGVDYHAQDDGMFVNLFDVTNFPPVHIGYMDWIRPGSGMGKIKASVKKGFKAEKAKHHAKGWDIYESQTMQARAFLVKYGNLHVYKDPKPTCHDNETVRLGLMPYEDQLIVARHLLFEQEPLPIGIGSVLNTQVLAECLRDRGDWRNVA